MLCYFIHPCTSLYIEKYTYTQPRLISTFLIELYASCSVLSDTCGPYPTLVALRNRATISNRSINSTSSKLSNSKNFHINTKNIQATTNIFEARREPTHAHRSPFNYPHSLPVSSCRRLDGRGRWWWGHSSICSSQVRGGC